MSTQPALLAGRNEIIEENLDLVDCVVKHLIKTLRLPPDDFDEYYADGLLGLVEAAGRFEPQRGTSFRSFAFLRIRGAVIDSLRQSSEISPRAYRYAKVLGGVNELRGVFQMPALSEICTPEEREEALANVLEYVMQGGILFRLAADEITAELEPELQDSDCAESQLLREAEDSRLRQMVKELPPKERRVIEGFYFRGKSFIEIAREEPPLSKSWVSRIHVRALRRIRDQLLRERQTER